MLISKERIDCLLYTIDASLIFHLNNSFKVSRSTHTYISSLLSSFHLVNSCSVCPSDDMDKLNISYNILKNLYNYILQNLWSRFNKVSFNQVPINYAKAFFQNLQSLSILFMLCYVNCWGPPCWNLPDIFFKTLPD